MAARDVAAQLRTPGIVVVPVTDRVSTVDWTSTVQSDRWWRWNGG
jgi:hypothetical protein